MNGEATYVGLGPQASASWQCVVEPGQRWRSPAGGEHEVDRVEIVRTEGRVWLSGRPIAVNASTMCGPHGWIRLPDEEEGDERTTVWDLAAVRIAAGGGK